MTYFLSARNQAGKYLRAFEMSFRNFAHRLAGVPNSIFRQITRLGRLDYSAALKGSSTPYLDMYSRLCGPARTRGRQRNHLSISSDHKT